MSVAIDITKFKNFKNKEWTPRQASITNQSRCKIDEGSRGKLTLCGSDIKTTHDLGMMVKPNSALTLIICN